MNPPIDEGRTAASKHHIYINGRFLTQQLTGVQRFAHEVVRALDEMLQECVFDRHAWRFTVLAPQGALTHLPLRHIELRQVGYLQGHVWEQSELPHYSRDGVLLNLCNTGPMFKPRQIVVIHDAAVFAAPQGYTRSFVGWYRLLLHTLVRSKVRIATVSEFSRAELARDLKVPAEQIVVITEGVDQVLRTAPDDGIFERAGIGARPFVLAVSSANPNKNFKAIAEAAAHLGEPDFDLVVAGNTNSRIFGQSAQLPKFIRQLGYVSDAELVALYRRAACFVFPSKYEGFGLPPIEAMACGAPVIVARAASMPEVCGEGAIYFDPDRADELAVCIRRVMGDASLRASLTQYGRARVRSFSWHRCAARLTAEAAEMDRFVAPREELAVAPQPD
jgi:glycosyltransferase involved in cell wall biosynthesis